MGMGQDVVRVQETRLFWDRLSDENVATCPGVRGNTGSPSLRTSGASEKGNLLLTPKRGFRFWS